MLLMNAVCIFLQLKIDLAHYSKLTLMTHLIKYGCDSLKTNFQLTKKALDAKLQL